jgi:hypothetical protein
MYEPESLPFRHVFILMIDLGRMMCGTTSRSTASTLCLSLAVTIHLTIHGRSLCVAVHVCSVADTHVCMGIALPELAEMSHNPISPGRRALPVRAFPSCQNFVPQ